jgi:hypothetical protein
MKHQPRCNSLVLLSFPLVVCRAASGATEEKLETKFTVQPGGTLVVDVELGSINVSTNAAN